MPKVFCGFFFPSLDPWLLRSKSPVGNPQLIQFSREVIDLLKNQPSCILPISNFIPSYHHHFAKQCRVSDYGYSKLIELLEAVPHVLQVKGTRGYLFKERSVLPWLQLPQSKTQTNGTSFLRKPYCAKHPVRTCFKMQLPFQVLRELQISNLEQFPRGLWAFPPSVCGLTPLQCSLGCSLQGAAVSSISYVLMPTRESRALPSWFGH